MNTNRSRLPSSRCLPQRILTTTLRWRPAAGDFHTIPDDLPLSTKTCPTGLSPHQASMECPPGARACAAQARTKAMLGGLWHHLVNRGDLAEGHCKCTHCPNRSTTVLPAPNKSKLMPHERFSRSRKTPIPTPTCEPGTGYHKLQPQCKYPGVPSPWTTGRLPG